MSFSLSCLKKQAFFLMLSLLLSACTEQPDVQTPSSVSPERYNPAAAVYNTQLGVGYLQEGNISRAKSKLLLAQKQDPNSPEVWSALAYFYEMTDNNTMADKYYLKAINLDPKKGSSLNNYGAFLCKKGQYQKSLTYFAEAVADPAYLNDASTYENAGLCAEEIPNKAAAQKFFMQALDNNPSLPTSTLELGQINFDNGKFSLANKYLQRYNQLAKPSAESIWLDLQLAREVKDQARVKADAALLKENFPESNEYKQVKLSGLEQVE
ncbi:MAG: type IV pilus biogenesis/stability protein PilW [Legionellales bacterium]|nr:type IV pilus biogenesis/stability protein PilW [Legionellales bacterium]